MNNWHQVIFLVFASCFYAGTFCVAKNTQDTLFNNSKELISASKKTENQEQNFSYLALLGDAHYQLENFTEAIIQYERARKFNTNNVQLNTNLISAYKQTNNRANKLIIEDIENSKNTFLNPKLLNIYSLCSIALLTILLLLMLLAIIRKKRMLTLPNTITLISFLFLSTLTLLTYSQLSEKAIIINDEVTVFETTSGISDGVSVLNSGYKVELLQIIEDWAQVKLITGKIGWVQKNTLEPI